MGYTEQEIPRQGRSKKTLVENTFLKITLFFYIWPNIMYDVPERVGPHSKILKKIFVVAPAALGTKYETRHTSLFRQKLGSLAI